MKVLLVPSTVVTVAVLCNHVLRLAAFTSRSSSIQKLSIQHHMDTGPPPRIATFDPSSSSSSSFSFVSKQDAASGRLFSAAADEEESEDGGATDHPSETHRYEELLQEVGLQDQVTYAKKLPQEMVVSTEDIFCNRELQMEKISAIGFDMDYTLAQYKQPAFDKLGFDGAIEKLVSNYGYPKEVLDFVYDHEHWVRGLIIDTQRGNFLKIDRHKYVRVAYHGFDEINSNTRKHLYSRTFNKVQSFSEKHYVNMDTLFQFVDAHLFALLIELKDKGEYDVLDYKTYAEIYIELRECVDLCHRDGVIKDVVATDPAKYLVLDDDLIPMLQAYKQEGTKLFLLTNSLWEYTSTAMNYLYHGTLVSPERQVKNEWMELFDLVIVGSCKPAYMIDPYLNLFRVNPADGSLLNTDGLYEIDALGQNGAAKFLQQGKVFQGGNWKHLHAMLEIAAGEEILYVGDHLYSDVLRSKRTLGWRSAFIMPELENEMIRYRQNSELTTQIISLRVLRDELSAYADDIRRGAVPHTTTGDDALQEMAQEDSLIKEKIASLAYQWHTNFHPIWGAMFNAGYQDSRFAFYVQNYACLYTSKATNFGKASSKRVFQTGAEMLPHERIMNSSSSTSTDLVD